MVFCPERLTVCRCSKQRQFGQSFCKTSCDKEFARFLEQQGFGSEAPESEHVIPAEHEPEEDLATEQIRSFVLQQQLINAAGTAVTPIIEKQEIIITKRVSILACCSGRFFIDVVYLFSS
jgi:hypothetical protein